MSFFEAGMLICFGAAWPVSIYKSLKTGKTGSKSLVFLIVIFLGYLSGITHKILYKPDPVLFLYSLNAVMVAVDTILYVRNKRREEKNEIPR